MSKKPTNKEEIKELKEDLHRAQADFINLKRRSDEEKAQLSNYVKQQVVLQLLPVIDNLDRALTHQPKELSSSEWAQGLSKVADQLHGQLAQMGVTKIEAVGQEFDPHVHEAVSMEEGSGKKEIVSEELQAGYMIGDEVIRHAIVKVKKG